MLSTTEIKFNMSFVIGGVLGTRPIAITHLFLVSEMSKTVNSCMYSSLNYVLHYVGRVVAYYLVP